MNATSRREFLAGAGALALLAGCATRGPKAAQPTNVVLLMADEHHARYAPPFHACDVQTPNLDRLAQMGTVFEHAYCPSPLCMPSRSAFMAGRPVHALQTYSNCNAVESDYQTYGAALASQGIHTAYIGKTDVFRPGNALGFSEMILPGDRAKPGDTMFRRNPLAIRKGDQRAGGYGPVDGNPFEHDDAMIAAAVDWLKTRPRQMAGAWSLTVNIGKPHFPHYVTPELWDLYPEGGDLPKFGREAASAQHPYARDLRAHFTTESFTEEQVRGLRRGYLGCVTAVDRQVGKLLEVLKAQGLLDNTLFAYTADHGDMLGKFGMWWKCSLYEDSVRVPLIVAGPGFDAGRRVRTPVESHDVRASMFRALSARQPKEWRGQALQHAPDYDPHRAAFFEYHGHGVRSGAFGIRKGEWKLLYNMAAPHQLFNLDEDPEELVNLFDKAPKQRKALEAELRAICNPERENRRAHQFELRLANQLGV